jgi:hypothetical protein
MKRAALALLCACSGNVGGLDAGPDGGDAGAPDAAVSDAGAPDSGSPDAGPTDSGVPDAGPTVPPYTDRCSRPAEPADPTPLRTLYVDSENGDDTHDGLSAAQAWKTLAKVNNSVQPGDLVYVSGTFDGGYLRPNVDGTASNPIVFKAQNAVIANAQYGVGLWIGGHSYLVFDGFELTGDEQPVDFLSSSFITVRNSNIHDTTGYVRFIDSDDNRFVDNRWADCPGYCVFLTGASHRNALVGNQLGGVGNTSLFLTTSGTPASSDNDISFNDLDEEMIITGAITGTTLACNLIHGVGLELIDGGLPGPALTVTSSGNRISDNVFFGNRGEAIRLQAFLGNDSNDNVIEHNDVVANGGPDLRMLLSEPDASLARNEVRDNIFWGNDLSDDFHWVSNGVRYAIVFDTYHQAVNGYPDGGLGDNHIHHNLLGSVDGGWLYFIGYSRNATYTLDEAQANWPADLHDNFDADPLFFDAGAGLLMLTAGSPAIDRAGPDDAGATVYGAGPDLGRYEAGP